MYFGIPLSSHPDPPSSSSFPQLCVFFHFKLIEFNLCCSTARVEAWPRMWVQGSCRKSSLARDGILCSLACLQAGTPSGLIMWWVVHGVTNFCEFICAASRLCLEKLAWNHPPPLALTIFLPHLPQSLWALEGCEVYTSHLGLAIQLFSACWPVEHLLMAIYWKKLLLRRLRNPDVQLLKDG